MSETKTYSSSIAKPYAAAMFALAKESKKLGELEKDSTAFLAALEESDALLEMFNNPVYARSEQLAAIDKIASKMKLRPILGNTLRLMASKRRLFAVPQLLLQLQALIAEEKGEISVEVTSAKKLSKAQSDALSKSVAKIVGKKINIQAEIDPTLIGGLIVKIGSRMIDSSIRSQLSNLNIAMKEVG